MNLSLIISELFFNKKVLYQKYILLALFFLIQPYWGKSQSWDDWARLYRDAVITVDVRFYSDPNSCSEKNMNRISYRITGRLSSREEYLVWQTDYIGCDGKVYFQEHCLNIGKGSEIINGDDVANSNIWADPNDEFLAWSIVRKYYNVSKSDKPSRKSGIRVPTFSTPALTIDGENNVEYQSKSTLTINGGELGRGANWIWYEKSCGGRKIGEGESIIIEPLTTTTYYVRAEGEDTTKCVQKTVKVISKRPDNIFGGEDIKIDNTTTLSVSGGKLLPGSKWVWYEKECGGKRLGQGTSLVVRPQISTRYYVRAEGVNDRAECTSVFVSVLSRDPRAISVSQNQIHPLIGQTIDLTVEGGYLGTGDKWTWYEGQCGGKKIGIGSQITVSPIESVSYFVRSEGNHTATSCATINIEPVMPDMAVQSGNVPYFDDVKWEYHRGQITLKYKIKNSCVSDRYNISIKAFRNSGILSINTLQGSLANVRGSGRKVLRWDALRDGYLPGDKLVFNISGTISQKVPLIPKVLKSAIFPGWGDIHLRDRNTRLILGVVGYSFAAASLYLNSEVNRKYGLYKNTTDLMAQKRIHQDLTNQNYISLGCAGAAGFCWTFDLVGVLSRHRKVKNELEKSNYYFRRSQNTMNTYTAPATIIKN
jgi:hypothetical protein